MYCSECGKEMPENAVFCPECGARQTGAGLSGTAAGSAAAAGIPSREQKKAKKHRRIGKAVVGLIVIAVGIAGWNIRGMWQERELSTVVKYQDLYCLDQEAGIIYDRNGSSYGRNVTSAYESMDGTIMAYLADGNLYYLKDSGSHAVDQDVESNSVRFSSSGEVIVYEKSLETSDGEKKTALYVYGLKDDTPEMIAENVGIWLLSGDGETVAYTESENDEKNILYIKRMGKQPVKVAKNDAIPLLIGAEKLLYEKNGKLYLYNGKESNKITSLKEEKFDGGYANINGTELLYSDGGYIYFLDLNTEENRKIVSGNLHEISGGFTGRFSTRNTIVNGVKVCGLGTLCNKTFSTDMGEVYYLNKRKEATRLSLTKGSKSAGNTYLFSDDWNQYLFLSESALFLVDNIKDGKEKKLTEDEVKYVTCSGDLKEIYYLTENDELYCLKNGKSILLSDAVNHVETDCSVKYSEKLKGVLFIEDDDLYFAEKSKKSRELLCENVEAIYLSHTGDYFYIDEEVIPDSSIYESQLYWMANKNTFIKTW